MCVCEVWGGRVPFLHMYEWACHSPPCDWCIFTYLYVCVWEREKKGTAISRPSSLFPWMASAGGNCPSLSSYLAEVFFLHHLMLNSSTFPCHFFCPSECLQIRFSWQTVSCWGLNGHGRCMVHQKEHLLSLWLNKKKKKRLFLWSGITKLNCDFKAVFTGLLHLPFVSKTALIKHLTTRRQIKLETSWKILTYNNFKWH